MSTKQKRVITIAQRNAAQWQRDKAIRHWLAGRWEEYAKHIRIADKLHRR